MNRSWESIIEPALVIHQPRVVVEIGTGSGANTRKLLTYCAQHDAILHAIDPQPRFDVAAWQREFGGCFVFHQGRSLDVLPSLGPADAVLIDGDHNWFTVYNELVLIHDASRADPRGFPIVFLHDVGWPYGRRDVYFNPDDIPVEFRQPHRQAGILPGEDELRAGGGVNAHLHNAVREGGARNGVRTAAEDFMREKGDGLELVCLPGLNGLGIVCQSSSELGRRWLCDIIQAVHDPIVRPMIDAVERDRIDLHVRWSQANRRIEADRLERIEQSRVIDQALEASRHLEQQLAASERARMQAEALSGELRARLDALDAALQAKEATRARSKKKKSGSGKRRTAN